MASAHVHVTTCRRDGGPTNDFCSCEHCCLAVCSVCGCYEGSLTTDCPGHPVPMDIQDAVYTLGVDYTDELKWHTSDDRPRPSFRAIPARGRDVPTLGNFYPGENHD